ncbi:unannotated protein [freshwater metagenome]|uniref:Unannotated protein n=1 Tax=freshwater metagenome TaxID=449393 RepID=A0A6J6IP18_9ZZZZ
MGVAVGLLDIVQVVGGQQRNLQRPRDAQQIFTVATFDPQSVIHQFAVKVVRAKDVAQVAGHSKGLVVVSGLEPAIDLTTGATGRPDDPLGISLEQFTVKPRFVVIPLKTGQARQPKQVVQPLGGLSKQRHVGVVLASLARSWVFTLLFVATTEVKGTALTPALGCVVTLQADDGLNAGRLGSLVKIVSAEQVAMVSHGNGWHLELGCLGD